MLRSGSHEDIVEMFQRMNRERRRLIKMVFQLAYFTRGCIQYKDMLNLSGIEREIINEFIEERLEAEGKKMYPVY